MIELVPCVLSILRLVFSHVRLGSIQHYVLPVMKPVGFALMEHKLHAINTNAILQTSLGMGRFVKKHVGMGKIMDI